MKKSTWLCLILLWITLPSIAQNSGKFRRLTSETGLNIQTTLDSRYTANPVQYLGFQTRTGYEFGAANKINRIELSFAKNIEKVEGLVNYVNLNSGIRYTHLRATKRSNFYLVGYMDYGNLLIFPRGAEFTNNPITYTFWLSVGAAAKWKKAIQLRQKKINIAVNGALPLLGYVIRPAYAHPYAENYLVDGVFDFERTNMGKYLVKSGHLRSLNQFMNAQLKTTVGVPFGKKAHEIGLSYNWEFVWVGGVQKIWHSQQQLSINLKINFNAK